MNISPVTTNQNYKQQNFGALKINIKGTAHLRHNQSFNWALGRYNLSRFTGLDANGKTFIIIPSRKRSIAEGILTAITGQDKIESISINEARKMVEKSFRSKGLKGKDAKAPF